MTDDLIAQIQSFTLAVRATLETEAGQQLEGIYGWLPDGTFGSSKGYPALGKLDEARETRQRLEQFAEDEKVAGLDAKRRTPKTLFEETPPSLEQMNRLAAFRLMEERKLLRQTIVRLAQSNGFIFKAYATRKRRKVSKPTPYSTKQSALPVNAMGEGPSDVACRRFLLLAGKYGELARAVSVLFDPVDTLASRLCSAPSPLQNNSLPT